MNSGTPKTERHPSTRTRFQKTVTGGSPKKMKKLIAMAMAVALAPVMVSQAAIFSNFELPAYTNASSWNGRDGWSGSASFNVVSPDPLASGYNWVINNQSGTLLGGTFQRGWGGLTNEITLGGFDVSVSMLRPEDPAGAFGGWYLSDNFGATAKRAGIELSNGGSGYQVYVWDGATENVIPLATYSWAVGHAYATTLQFDLTPGANKITALIQGVTTNGVGTNGPVVNLGTFALKGSDLNVANIQTLGGLYASSTVGATVFDDMTVLSAVPEPSVAALALLGLGGLMLRRRIRVGHGC